MVEVSADPITAKLIEHIPGAQVLEVPNAAPEARFIVVGRNPRSKARKSSQLAHGYTKREAVDRALFLFGSNR